MGVSCSKEIHGTIICHGNLTDFSRPAEVFFKSPIFPKDQQDGGTWNFHLRIVLYQVHPMRQQCGKPERQEAKNTTKLQQKWSYLHFFGGSMGVCCGKCSTCLCNLCKKIQKKMNMAKTWCIGCGRFSWSYSRFKLLEVSIVLLIVFGV